MIIYNKIVSYTGCLLSIAGICLEFSHIKQDALVYALLTIGIIMMVLGFRKSSNQKRGL
jgi:hypothetical protein